MFSPDSPTDFPARDAANAAMSTLGATPNGAAEAELDRRATGRRTVDQETRNQQARDRRLRDLNEIGLALSSQRDIERLLELILTKSRELTGADAGSLFLIEKDPSQGNSPESELYFHSAQNESIQLNTTNVTFAVSPSSLAGYSALTGQTLCFDDVHELAPDEPYKFNPAFDREHGYRTKSILVLPLKNHADQVMGVLQLINRKRHRNVLLSDESVVEQEVLPFDEELVDLARSLASQAAVALENNLLLAEVRSLLDEISNLFDAFVMASADAIEGRDPSTSGHSKRVTILTVAMARAANEETQGPFKDIYFSPSQIKELHYATLLHDFGKIGVREHVLLKSHKIDPMHFQAVKDRIALLRRSKETDCARQQIAVLRRMPLEQAQPILDDLDARRQEELDELSEAVKTLTCANDPAVTRQLDEEYEHQQKTLHRLAAMSYEDETGTMRPLLDADELHALSVRRGSLTPEEYEQIQTHATFSYNFLKQIPWTKDLQQIPNLAHCHHEKLNGKGYPRGIRAEQIPIAARMMTVADIYDALTAAERPYKKPISTEDALRILHAEAATGGVDRDVLNLFITHQIYKQTEDWHSGTFALPPLESPLPPIT